MIELFPTCLRGLGTGIIRAIGSAGAILASFEIYFCEELHVNVFAVMGFLGLLA